MNTFEIFAFANISSIVERLGWVLIHSVWQFAAVAMLSILVVRSLRRSSASTRYSFLVFAMASLSVCPIVTWYAQDPEIVVAREVNQLTEPSRLESLAKPSRFPQATSGDRLEIPFEQQATAIETESNFAHSTLSQKTKPARLSLTDFKNALRPWLTWIVVLWCLGVTACALRPTLSWFAIRRMRRVGTLPVSNELLDVLCRVSRQLGVTRSVQLFQSTLVHVPVVLGYLRPMILLPISLLNNLPLSQLETILAHELAHVRRHDFLANLLQTVVETFFFYHPAVWWLSHRIRIEREHCCDDLVIQVLGNRVEYGRALVAIEQLRGDSVVLALGAADGSMLARIRRIVTTNGNTRGVSSWSPWNAMATSLIVAAVTGMLCWQGFAQTTPKPTSQPKLNNAANTSSDAPFTAKLPNGARVEFVGITEGAGDIKAAERWWKPDGTPLGLAPEYGGAGGGSEEVDKQNPYARTVIHVHGIEDNSAVTVTAAIQTAESKVEVSGGRYIAHYGYTDAPSATRSFEVGVATEPLSLVRWLDRNGNRQGYGEHWFRANKRLADRTVGFALVGLMDIDGDQKDDSSKLKEMIRMAHGRVDAVLDSNLVTEGSFGTGTAFVILGTDVQAIGNKDKAAKYAKFIAQARSLGATQMSLEKLVSYLKSDKLRWPDDVILEDITVEKVGPETWGQHVKGYGPMIDPVGPGDAPGGRKTGTTQVTIRVPLNWHQVDLRLFAIDKVGKSHGVDMTVRLEPNEENADYARLAKILPVAFEDVDHFEYQFRLYRHWVTFENVSLRRGKETQVNIKTETIPQLESKTTNAEQVNDPDANLILGERLAALAVPQPEFALPDFLNVRSVGFSEDSQRLVSVATKEDVTIRTWSIEEKKLVNEVKLDRAVDGAAPLHGNQFLMSGLKLSQDLKRLVGCVEGNVRIWSTEDGKLIQTLPNPIREGGAIESRGLTSTPNFDSIAAAIGNGFGRSRDCEIAVWQGEGYGRIKRLPHTDAVQITSMALSADGSRLASGCQNATTCVFDLATSKLLYTLPNSNGDRKHSDSEVSESGANQILCLAFSPDGKKLAIGDMLGVKIVDATDGKLLQTIESEFRFGMSGLVFSKDGKLLARTASDKTVPIWSTETGKLVTELPTEAHDAAFSNDGKWFATGFSDDKQALSVWKRAAEPQRSTTNVRATLTTEKIVINKDGEIWLNRNAVTLEEFRSKLQSMSNNSFEIAAESDVPYTKVVEVLNVLNAAGVTELSFREARIGDGKVRIANRQAIYKFDDHHGFSICRPNGHPHYFTVHWRADGRRPACMLRTYPETSDETVGKWAVAWEPDTEVLWWVDDFQVGKMNLKDPAAVIVERENRFSDSFPNEFGLPEEVKTEFQRLGFVVGLDNDPTDKDISISPRPGTPGRGAGGEGQVILSAQIGSCVIEGTVLSVDGTPIPNVPIRVSSNEELKMLTTDANGKYSATISFSLQQYATWRGVKVEPVLDGYGERDMAKSGELNSLIYVGEQLRLVRNTEVHFEAGPIPRFAQGPEAATADFVMVKANDK